MWGIQTKPQSSSTLEKESHCAGVLSPCVQLAADVSRGLLHHLSQISLWVDVAIKGKISSFPGNWSFDGPIMWLQTRRKFPFPLLLQVDIHIYVSKYIYLSVHVCAYIHVKNHLDIWKKWSGDLINAVWHLLLGFDRTPEFRRVGRGFLQFQKCYFYCCNKHCVYHFISDTSLVRYITSSCHRVLIRLFLT